MSFCPQCGKQVSQDFNLCPYCGKPLKITEAEKQPPIQSTVVEETKPKTISCSRCSAPLNVSKEDVIITCRYCGFTISVATQAEIKKHSMLENHLTSQQAVDTAKHYMDKGILRYGVAKEAQILSVKLKYIPFWTFPASATTAYRGRKGARIAQLREMGHAITDKKESGFVKFGKFLKAGASLYAEQKLNTGPKTVSETFSSQYNWTTLARKALISDINYYEVPIERKIPFDSGRISADAEFLNTEMMENEVKTRVIAEVEMKQRDLVGERVDSIEVCNTNVAVGEGELIHTPVWFVSYTLKGENYAIAVDGCNGKVLGGGRPFFKIT